MTRAIELGKIAITEDFESLATADGIDVVIDATGNPNTGALFALTAMQHGKHVVMLNVEADITIGRYLKAEARRAGVVYTGAAGDEPAATVELIGFARCLGLDIVAAGKGKNNPLRFDATPDAYQEEARARNMNARMLVEFVDGSKTMIEMTAIANATGLVPDKPGMHGPNAAIGDLADVLCPARPWRRALEAGRRRLQHRQGCRSRRLLHRRDAAPAGSRTHGRSQSGQGPVLHPLPPISSDQPRNAAFGGACLPSPASRHRAP